MTFEQLVDFIEHRMTMSHVYQPVLIRSLVDAGGKATLRQLAQAFLAQDESQLLYYEDRIKKMPLPSNRDATDFRIETESGPLADCDFYEPQIKDRIVEECESTVAIHDRYSVTEGHILVIPRGHTPDRFGMLERERIDANDLLHIL